MKIPILTYHSLDETGSVISTAPENFRRQMKFLSENGYRAVSLGELVEGLRSNKTPPPKSFALTFDDGFRSVYSEAFPVLAAYGFTATVFLVTDFCGGYNDWSGGGHEVPRRPLLSWREIKEMRLYGGIEFGSHTRTHPDLTALSAVQVENELAGSKALIEDRLGCEAALFAYPYGKLDPTVKKAVERIYRAAFSVKLGKIGTESDFFALERIDGYYLSNKKIFRSLSSGVFDFYLHLRQDLRDFKSLMRRQFTN